MRPIQRLEGLLGAGRRGFLRRGRPLPLHRHQAALQHRPGEGRVGHLVSSRPGQLPRQGHRRRRGSRWRGAGGGLARPGPRRAAGEGGGRAVRSYRRRYPGEHLHDHARRAVPGGEEVPRLGARRSVSGSVPLPRHLLEARYVLSVDLRMEGRGGGGGERLDLMAVVLYDVVVNRSEVVFFWGGVLS